MNYSAVPTDEGQPVSPPRTTPSRGSRYAVIAIGAAVIGGMAYLAKRPTSITSTVLVENTRFGPTSSAADIASQKVVYGDKTEAEIEKIFEDFMANFKKPYASDPDAKAVRYTQFKSNLNDIDQFNARNPYAVFGITDRADWTSDERSKMRGMKSATLAKAPGETRSSYKILKDEYPDQQVVAMGEKGAEFVRAEALKRKAFVEAAGLEDLSSYSVGGDSMSEAMFPWVTEDDCAACDMFPAFSNYSLNNTPTNFDWRNYGAVSAVTNQKYCGSCWTFSTAQDVEGTHFLATGELTPLSEQQLVACDPLNDGCDGGWPFRAFEYVHKIGGLVHEVAYPYKGICSWDACDENADGADDATPTCATDVLVKQTEAANVSAIGGFQLVAMGASYETLAEVALVKNGPLSIAFNANGMDYYIHGIVGKEQCNMTANDGDVQAGCIMYGASPEGEWTCDPTAIDHAVLIVGYGEQDDLDYWVIKNSWSDAWGEEGYYRLVRGVNECGVANFISHSVIKGADAESLADDDTSSSYQKPSKTEHGHSKSKNGEKTNGK